MQRICVFLILLFIVLSAAMPIFALAQATGESAQDKEAMAQRINEIIESTLKRGEFVLDNDVHGYTFIPPSNEDIAEIKKMGSKAIPVLVQHLDSQNSFREQLLAIRFLGNIDDEDAVKALGEVVLGSSNSMSREFALKWLSKAPWDSIREYVLRAVNDVDQNVRKAALQIEAAHQ